MSNYEELGQHSNSPAPFGSMRVMAFNSQGEVLALRRCNGEQSGLWELPGGKAEDGEAPTETISREYGEEVGTHKPLVLFEEEFYSLGSRTFTNRKGQQRTIFSSVMFGLTDDMPPTLDPLEHDDARLVSPLDIARNPGEFTVDALAAARLWIQRSNL